MPCLLETRMYRDGDGDVSDLFSCGFGHLRLSVGVTSCVWYLVFSIRRFPCSFDMIKTNDKSLLESEFSFEFSVVFVFIFSIVRLQSRDIRCLP